MEGAGEHPLPRTTNPLIPQHALWMSQHGYSPSTIKATVKTLKTLSRRCNLANPTEVKTHLATHPYSENRRFKIINDLNRLYKQLGIAWERPRSRRVDTLPFLPTEEEPNQLIGGLGPKLACYMFVVKGAFMSGDV